VDLESGRVLHRIAVDGEYFAEGLTRVGEQLVQLTWQSGRALVYSRDGFERVREHTYSGEGWGLCYDGTRLVMSDGSDELTFRDPTTFAVSGRMNVTKLGRPLRRLNELECSDGAVYANVWTTNEIVRIDPRSGRVTATIDASGLLSVDEAVGADVLNGIAHVPGTDRFLVTGKLWPWIFEVRFVER
jgi:glutaminyl-peptide cyclotransferase